LLTRGARNKSEHVVLDIEDDALLAPADMLAFKRKHAQPEHPANRMARQVPDAEVVENGAGTAYFVIYPSKQNTPIACALNLMGKF
jgi:hypothetical protein